MLKRHLLHKQKGAFAHTPQTGLTQNLICHIKQSDRDKRDGSQNPTLHVGHTYNVDEKSDMNIVCVDVFMVGSKIAKNESPS